MTTISDIKVDAESGRRAGLPARINRILMPTDLTNESQSAIDCGLLLAQYLGASLTLLHVYQQPYPAEYLCGPNISEKAWRQRMYLVNRLKFSADNVKGRYADCDTEFREGEPCEEIIHTAKERDVDLIILSTHHYNWLTRLACGCDTETILRHAPCPILVLPVNGEKGPRPQPVSRIL